MWKGLAVEGGGTKTTAVVFQGLEILGLGLSGSSNFVEVGERRAEIALRKAIQRALEMANLSLKDVERASFALAGIGDSPNFTLMGERMVRRIFPGAVIVNDGVVACKLAHLNQDGGALVAGTGNVAYIQKRGELKKLAGWGWFFGDEGSASYIGKRGIAMATRALDGLIDSQLPKEVEKFFKAPIRVVIERFTRRPNKRKIASFARVVDRLAEQGDPGAKIVMSETIEYINSMLTRMRREVDRVAGTGGVFKSKMVRRAFPDLRVYEGYQTVIGSMVLLLENVREEDRDELLNQLETIRKRF
ncbi:BadF/BadG/BcrA/BcrD ATPase family protein [Metallosphaera javensis (ex Sakai et al. 2022)]|uniref:BadF/BadG/BcrA/BcrD ATPase family protein n=1 Tax=Metallosphaera javensis (ex Sakai et al. 2022) TaxID=2775498 RepID=UPI00258EF642|nr:MAG: ATPase [Metallosphaera javensis (ex Sakai et al. 2022)]